MIKSELRQLVKNGKLEITQILSPTRTVSTALSIALAESCDGQVHEPLHHIRRKSFEKGLEIILKRVKFLQEVNKEKEKIKIVVKDLAKYISAEEWKELLDLVKHVVFTIREPSNFLFSLVKRRANDMVEFGSTGLSTEDILKRMPNIPEKSWRDKSWKQLDKLLKITEMENRDKLVIISGLSLKLDPFGVMKRLSERFGWLPFNENMVNNWTVASGVNFYNSFPTYAPDYYNTGVDENGIEKTAYYRSAVKSGGFKPLNKEKDRPVNMEIFTPSMQEYLFNEVWPVYFRLMCHSHNISRPSVKQLSQNNCPGGLRFDQINPVEAFALLNTYPELDVLDEVICQQLLNSTREILQKDHSIVLDRLESLIKENNIN